MTYELSKKLKDAGFPQWGIKGEILTEPNYIKRVDSTDGMALAPSLSELIDACGEHFSGIQRGRKNQNGYTDFLAYGLTDLTSLMVWDVDGRGKTIDEAVANLWLELNKGLKRNIK